MKKQIYLLFIISIFTSMASEKALGVEVYVWQRDWNPYVQKAIKEATDKIKIDSFMVLTGDYVYEPESENLNFKTIPVNWSYFNPQAKVTTVFRINAQASKRFSKRRLQPTIDKIGSDVQASIEYAKSKGVNVTGVQIDYDCPTSKLKDYQRLLIGLRKKFPQLLLSVTVLPTWLADKNFKQLLKPASFYVLQVHSFERPQRISEALEIFSEAKVPFYIKQASSFNIPYYVSLPTYGYEVGFDEAGNFIGIRAEGPPIAWEPKCQRKFITSDPEKIVSLLRYLKASKPLNCLGVAWFRLPVETDEFNWAWSTFAAVIAGRLPRKSFKTDVFYALKRELSIKLYSDARKVIAEFVKNRKSDFPGWREISFRSRERKEPEKLQLDIGFLTNLVVPKEFIRYIEGAIAYHNADFETAIMKWNEILALPKAERQYKTTWASFMIGKAYLSMRKNKEAIAYFEKTREYAKEGYKDSLNLAFSSYGWQALAEKELGAVVSAMHHYFEQLDALSLSFVCRNVFTTDKELFETVVKDNLCRNILVAWLVSRPMGYMNYAYTEGYNNYASRLFWNSLTFMASNPVALISIA